MHVSVFTPDLARVEHDARVRAAVTRGNLLADIRARRRPSRTRATPSANPTARLE